MGPDGDGNFQKPLEFGAGPYLAPARALSAACLMFFELACLKKPVRVQRPSGLLCYGHWTADRQTYWNSVVNPRSRSVLGRLSSAMRRPWNA